jgi:2-polyprenyl-3-methyl-5-hydroxy-6-metoxy-1,4-benzoquinol methylase
MKIVIFGAGNIAKNFYYECLNRNVSVIAMIDNEKTSFCPYMGARIDFGFPQEKYFEDIQLPVYKPNAILNMQYDLIVLAVVDNEAFKSMRQQILNLGIDEKKIVYYKNIQLEWKNEYLASIPSVRLKKEKYIKEVIELSKPHIIHDDGKYNFLTSDTTKYFKIIDTENISAHPYEYEGLENDASKIILDVGCGFRAFAYYENVIYSEICNYPSTDIICAGQDLPFKENSFDAVFCYSVLEHVTDPMKCASEMVRVCKQGGLIYCAVPHLVPYHGYPNHYFNFTPGGAKLLFEKECDITSTRIGYPAFTLSWLLSVYASGLHGKIKSEFLDMKVRDIHNCWNQPNAPWIREISEESIRQISDGTKIIAKKR